MHSECGAYPCVLWVNVGNPVRNRSREGFIFSPHRSSRAYFITRQLWSGESTPYYRRCITLLETEYAMAEAQWSYSVKNTFWLM